MGLNYVIREAAVSGQERSYINKKIQKIKEKLLHYQENELHIDIDISQDKRNFWRLEVMIKTPHHLFRGERTKEVLTEAMDEVEEALAQQIKKNKEKMRDLGKRGARAMKKSIALDRSVRF